jgi:hypothetical protein
VHYPSELSKHTCTCGTDARASANKRALAINSGIGIGDRGTIAGAALSATNQRLVLAAILAILAVVIYVAPFAAFFIGIMIYGF